MEARSPAIQPGTSKLEALKYLFGSGTSSKIGSGLGKALLAAVVLWFGNDKRLQFRDDTSVADIKVLKADVDKLKGMVAGPVSSPDSLLGRVLGIKKMKEPPWPPTNTGKIKSR